MGSALTNTFGPRWIGEQHFDCAGGSATIAIGKQPARLAIVDEIPVANNVAGNHQQSGPPGFQHREGHALPARSRQIDVRVRHRRSGIIDWCVKYHPPSESTAGNFRRQAFAVQALAIGIDVKTNAREMQAARDLNQQIGIFLPIATGERHYAQHIPWRPRSPLGLNAEIDAIGHHDQSAAIPIPATTNDVCFTSRDRNAVISRERECMFGQLVDAVLETRRDRNAVKTVDHRPAAEHADEATIDATAHAMRMNDLNIFCPDKGTQSGEGAQPDAPVWQRT